MDVVVDVEVVHEVEQVMVQWALQASVVSYPLLLAALSMALVVVLHLQLVVVEVEVAVLLVLEVVSLELVAVAERLVWVDGIRLQPAAVLQVFQ